MRRYFRRPGFERAGLVAVAVAASTPRPSDACGPEIPAAMLTVDDDGLCRAPRMAFDAELRADAPLPAAVGTAVTRTTAEVGAADLAAALDARGVSQDEQDRQMAAYREFRAGFEWNGTPQPDSTLAELPDEFRHYLIGASAYHRAQYAQAEAAFERVLALPPAQRHYRSVWAAYMLARMSLPDDRYERLAPLFRRVRDLATQGYADSAGLASASYGWEASLALAADRTRTAVHLYRQQLATGDRGAASSLRIIADDLADSAHPERLSVAAADPVLRSLVTRRIASLRRPTSPHTLRLSKRWLEALSVLGPRVVDDAEHLAWIAYRGNDMGQAERWLAHARPGLLARWLQAKLHLRAGRIDQGRALLESLATVVPADVGRFHSGRWGFDTTQTTDTDAAREVWAELGVIRLHEREFVAALDAFVRGHHWLDAAYVAERVLTIDELDEYLRAPDVMPEVRTVEVDTRWEGPPIRQQLRLVHARRLARAGRWSHAQAWFPEPQATQIGALAQQLEVGRDPTRSTEDRVRALWDAATTIRTSGLELLGTEMAPDYQVWGGSLAVGGVMSSRMSLRGALTEPSEQERRRVLDHAPSPSRRFHYRYRAAELAADAAALLPNGNEAKVRMLCNAGNWLKNRDPEGADPYYKAMVIGGRGTALGERADRDRWLPDEADCQLNPEHFDTIAFGSSAPSAVGGPSSWSPPSGLWLGVAAAVGLGAWGAFTGVTIATSARAGGRSGDRHG